MAATTESGDASWRWLDLERSYRASVCPGFVGMITNEYVGIPPDRCSISVHREIISRLLSSNAIDTCTILGSIIAEGGVIERVIVILRCANSSGQIPSIVAYARVKSHVSGTR